MDEEPPRGNATANTSEYIEELKIKTSRERCLYSEASPKQVISRINYLHSLSSGAYSCTIMPYLTMLLRAMYFKLNLTFMVVSVVSMRIRVDWSGVKTSIDT